MKSARLTPIQQFVEAREDAAVRAMLDAQNALAAEEQRLSNLVQYLTDYERSGALGSVSFAMLANRRAFLARLQEAVVQQEGLVESARLKVAAERARHLLASRDTAVIASLADCYRGRERAAAERLEQNAMDEFAAGRHGQGGE